MNTYFKKKNKKLHSFIELQDLAFKNRLRFLGGVNIDDMIRESRITSQGKKIFKQELAIAIMKWPVETLTIKEAGRMFEFLNKELKFDLGFIYCIELSGRIKIGKSQNFDKRLASYRSNSGQEPMVIQIKACHNHSVVEKMIKSRICKKSEWSEKEDLESTLSVMTEECTHFELISLINVK